MVLLVKQIQLPLVLLVKQIHLPLVLLVKQIHLPLVLLVKQIHLPLVLLKLPLQYLVNLLLDNLRIHQQGHSHQIKLLFALLDLPKVPLGKLDLESLRVSLHSDQINKVLLEVSVIPIKKVLLDLLVHFNKVLLVNPQILSSLIPLVLLPFLNKVRLVMLVLLPFLDKVLLVLPPFLNKVLLEIIILLNRATYLLYSKVRLEVQICLSQVLLDLIRIQSILQTLHRLFLQIPPFQPSDKKRFNLIKMICNLD